MQLQLQHTVTTRVEPSPHVLRVAAMFGLGVDETRTISLISPTTLDLPGAPCGGQVIFITGASGSGKSTLLRLIDQELRKRDDVWVIRFDDLPDLPDRPLVDCFGALLLEQVLQCLSLAGLNDAFVMLRKPSELSDGQRYRLQLAQAIAAVQQCDEADGLLTVVLADEFGATLDRLTATVIARNIRKWTRRQKNICFIAATTHDDLLEPLEPDVLIEKHLGTGIEVHRRQID